MRISPAYAHKPLSGAYPDALSRDNLERAWGMGGRVIQTLSGHLMWISLGWVSGPGDGPRHGMRRLSSQSLIRPYPPPIVVARGLIRPYPGFFVLGFLFNRKQ